MTPDELVTLGKTVAMVFTVICAFCAWLHVKSVS